MRKTSLKTNVVITSYFRCISLFIYILYANLSHWYIYIYSSVSVYFEGLNLPDTGSEQGF